MRRLWRNKSIRHLLAGLLALLVWQVLSLFLGSPLLLPGPAAVLGRLFALMLTGDFWQRVGFSLLRVGLGFGLGLVLGLVLGLLGGRFPLIQTLLWPYVAAMQAVPVASFIILSLLFLSAGQLPVLICFLVVFPPVYENVVQGVQSTSIELLEMGRAFGFSWWRRLKYLYLPTLKPFLLSACTVGVGMACKAGVAAEVIAVAAGSVGESLYEAKLYLLSEDLLAWTVAIVIFSRLLQRLLQGLMQAAFALWKGR